MSFGRQVPYAVMNYRELVKEDCLRVDHTRYLRELEKCQTPAFLRPKQFGKTLWVSMLERYHDVCFRYGTAPFASQLRRVRAGAITERRSREINRSDIRSQKRYHKSRTSPAHAAVRTCSPPGGRRQGECAASEGMVIASAGLCWRGVTLPVGTRLF